MNFKYLYNLKTNNLLIFCLVVFIYQNYQLIFSPILGDDIFNIQLKGFLIQTDKNFIELFLEDTVYWIINGEFTPLYQLLKHIIYLFVNNILAVKILYFILLSLSVASFCFLLKQITQDNNFLLFYLIFISIFFQYQNWHDAFLIFPIAVMPDFIFVTLSINFFIKFLKSNLLKHQIFSAIFLLVAFLFSNTTTMLFCVLYPILLYNYDKKINLIKIKYVFYIFLLFFVYLAYFKFLITPESKIYIYLKDILDKTHIYDGRILKIDLISNIYSFLIQIYGSLPFSVFNLDTSFSFKFYDIIYFFLIFFLFFIFLKKIKNLSKKKSLTILYISIFFLLSAIPISVSQKYVDQLILKGFGYSYIYVFYQFFGISLLFLIILIKYRMNNYIASVILSFFAIITLASNRSIVENNFYSFGVNDLEMKVMKKAQKENFFNDIEEFSNIYFETSKLGHFNSPQFLAQITEKKVFSNYYDIRLNNYDISDQTIKLKNNKFSDHYFILDTIKLKKTSKNTYVPIVNINKYKSIGKNWRPAKSKLSSSSLVNDYSKNIIQASKNFYYLKNIPTSEGIILLLAKVKEVFSINGKINDLYTSDYRIFFSKNNTFKIFKNKNSIKNLVSNINNGNFKVDQLNQNFSYANFFESYDDKNYQKNNNFYLGEIKCDVKKIKIKKSNFFKFDFLRLKFNSPGINLEVKNYSNHDWFINNFTKQNPITLRSILINTKDKTKTSVSGPEFTEFQYIVSKGQNKKIFINRSKMFESYYKISQKNNGYDLLMIDLVHEGKAFFHQMGFKPCYIKFNN